MESNINKELEDILPKKAWISLAEACAAKGLCLKTAYNRRSLQPLHGEGYSKIGGRKMWQRSVIRAWVLQTDKDLDAEGES